MKEPLLSVSVLTYNHEEYIEQALDSVLAQEVDFPMEIIVGDDCSSDGTRDILKRYQSKYPELISLILHPRRYDEIPGRTNNTTNLYNCRGKYIAMLDGDDYWCNPDKLQSQVDFLEARPDYVLSFHDALVIGEKGSEPYLRSEKNFPFLKEKWDYTHEDVANGWFMPTSSLVFRNIFQQELPAWFQEVIRADYALLLLMSQQGKARFFKDLVSVRRINQQSFTKTHMQTMQSAQILIEEFAIFEQHFPAFATAPSTTRQKAETLGNLISHHTRRNEYRAASRLFLRMAGLHRGEAVRFVRKKLMQKLAALRYRLEDS